MSASASPAPAPAGWFQRFLGLVERVGNLLPNPATLFALLSVVVVVASWFAATAGLQVINPGTGATIQAVNLLSLEGLHRMLSESVRNFINFPPLGTVLACLLGIAVAEHTGLIGACLRLIVLASPARLLTPMVILAGVMSNAGGDVGYVLLIPLAAAIFHSVGRHPLAGLFAAFAGVSAGFSANLLLGTIDVLLSDLTKAAARILDPKYDLQATANYYFMFTSTFLLTLIGWVVSERIVEPRLGAYSGTAPREPLSTLSAAEKRGLWSAFGTVALLASVVLLGVLPEDGFLRDPKHPADIFKSYLFAGNSLVTFILLFGLASGLAYGLGAGVVRNDHDVIKGMTASTATMASYIVMAFFAAQFIAYFNWTNLGTIMAVKGANAVTALGLQDNPILLMVSLTFFTAFMNLFMGSASAKWTLLAPIFVPMLMLLGVSPELTQAAYRVGDSCTNIITPLMSYFPVILAFAQRYEPRIGIGTMISNMLPYSMVFLAFWTTLLMLWIWSGLPVGPNAPLFLPGR